MKRLARASAWALLAGIIVLMVSGWGITQTGVIYRLTGGLVDRRLADTIHRDTVAPLTFVFLAHVLFNIRYRISPESTFKVWLTNIILIVVGVGLMAITIYMHDIHGIL
jgi:hypothetical protein